MIALPLLNIAFYPYLPIFLFMIITLMVLFTFQLPSSQANSSIFTFHSVSHVRRFLFFAGSHRRAYPQDFWDVLHQRLQHVCRGGIKPQEIRGCGQLTRDKQGNTVELATPFVGKAISDTKTVSIRNLNFLVSKFFPIAGLKP